MRLPIRILGIDPGLRRTGWGLIACEGNRLIYLACGSVETSERAPCLSLAAWATWDERLCVDDVVTVPVQVNGKVRARVDLPREAQEDEARARALEAEGMERQLAGKAIKKFIYVPGRVCNFIVA